VTIFGTITDGHEVEQAVIAHLRNWSLTYLAFCERHAGLPARSLDPIRTWTSRPRTPDRWAEEQLPAILVVCPGLQGEPYEDGEGRVTADWQISVGAVVAARSEEEATLAAHLYYKHTQLALLQRSDLGGFAEDVEWRGDSYDYLDDEKRRTMVGVIGLFAVRVSNIVNVLEGPEEPLENPYDDPGDWPQVVDTEILINEPEPEESS
jgi:hypothetical protein